MVEKTSKNYSDENMAWAKPTLFNEEFLTSSRNYANCENTPLQMFRKDFKFFNSKTPN